MTLEIQTFDQLLSDAEDVQDALLIPQRPPLVLPEKFREKDAGRTARRSAPIHGYCGPNGGGKSLAIAHDTLPSLESGRTVLSTMKFIRAETGEPYENYQRLTDWSQVMDLREGDIVLDEIIGAAGSRQHGSLPVEVQNLLVQLRRRDNVLRWSAPAWTRADLIVRETSQAVTMCRGYLSKPAYNAETGERMLWSQKRLFRWKTYDASDFEDWTSQKASKLKHESAAWFYGPGSRALHSYDTYDDVSRVGGIIESGRCMSCGGTRRAKACKCGPVEHSHDLTD